jgi:hypothetical protein
MSIDNINVRYDEKEGQLQLNYVIDNAGTVINVDSDDGKVLLHYTSNGLQATIGSVSVPLSDTFSREIVITRSEDRRFQNSVIIVKSFDNPINILSRAEVCDLFRFNVPKNTLSCQKSSPPMPEPLPESFCIPTEKCDDKNVFNILIEKDSTCIDLCFDRNKSSTEITIVVINTINDAVESQLGGATMTKCVKDRLFNKINKIVKFGQETGDEVTIYTKLRKHFTICTKITWVV